MGEMRFGEGNTNTILKTASLSGDMLGTELLTTTSLLLNHCLDLLEVLGNNKKVFPEWWPKIVIYPGRKWKITLNKQKLHLVQLNSEMVNVVTKHTVRPMNAWNIWMIFHAIHPLSCGWTPIKNWPPETSQLDDFTAALKEKHQHPL